MIPNSSNAAAGSHRPRLSFSTLVVALIVVLVLIVPGARVIQDLVTPTPTSIQALDPEVSSAAAGPVQPSAVPNLGVAPPDVSAQAVYAYDPASGSVLYAKNSDVQRPVASITKSVTALVTVNNASLDEQVPIVDSDLLAPDSQFTKMGLISGDTLTVAQLLYGLMLPSGGDAAKALARYSGTKVGGETNEDAARLSFVEMMNTYVKSLGLENSYFVDPDGESDQGFSTAHDIAMIGGELMKNADLKFIVSQPTQDVTSVGGNVYPMTNTNTELGKSGVIGIKTGSTEGAGASILLARQMDSGAIVIMSVLGSTLEYDDAGFITTDERYNDARTIFADMDTRFTWQSLSDSGDLFPTLAEEMSAWGVEFKDPPMVPIATGAKIEPTYQLVLGAPTDSGKQAGSVDIYSGDDLTGSVPVYQSGGDSAVVVPFRKAA